MRDAIESFVSNPGLIGVSYLMRPSPFLKKPCDIPLTDRDGDATMVRIEECSHDVGGSNVTTGLRIRTVVRGSNLADSMERAGELSEKVANICSITSNQGSPIVTPETVYQAGRVQERLSLFFVDFPMPDMPRREIEGHTAIGAFEDLNANFGPDQIERIYRSIKWYRKAITTRDIHDRLLWLWFGLVSLDSVLIDHLGLRSKEDEGIRHQINRLAESPKRVYKRAKRLRNRIAHPVEGRMPPLPESEAISVVLAAVLRTTLARLMELDVEDSRFFPTLQPEPQKQVNYVSLIRDEKGALDSISRDAPWLEFRGFKADIKMDRRKPTEILSDMDVRYHGPKGTQWKSIGFGMKNLQYGRLVRPNDGK